MISMHTLKTTLLTALLMAPCATHSNWPTSLLKGIKDTLLSPLRPQNSKKKSYTPAKQAARTSKAAVPKKEEVSRSTVQADYTLTESQAHDYIDNVIASFDLELRPHVKDTELTMVKQMLKEIIGQPHTWAETHAGKRYKKDIIDQYVNAAILQYIVRRSYDCALKYTKNENLAMDIAGTVFNTVLELIQQKGTLDMEELAGFLGKPLKKAIKERAKQIKHQNSTAPVPSNNPAQQQNAPAKIYPSEECCACFESFEKVTPVFLSPCGHDMCAECACEWFFGEHSKTSCPKCRSTVNLSQLAQAIQAS